MSLEFYSEFKALKEEISAALGTPSSDVGTVSGRLARLKGIFREHHPTLPAYDQRTYGAQLQELEAQVSALRAKAKPKSRFAFRTRDVSSSSSTVSSSSSALQPSRPQEAEGSGSTVANSSSSRPAVAGHVIASREKLSLITLPPESPSENLTLTLSDLHSSLVDLRPPPFPSSSKQRQTGAITSLHIKGVERCVVIVGQVGGSVMVTGLEGCLVVVACQQFRMHDSIDCTVLLHVGSLPVIEGCSGISFGPFPPVLLPYPLEGQCHHGEVQDFSWVREGHSPNWAILPDTASERFQEGVRELGTDVQRTLDSLLPLLT